MSLLPVFQWLNQMSLSAAMRESTWAFAVVEMIHLLGLAAIGAAILIVDLRLLGLILRRHPAERIVRDLSPLLVSGLTVMVVSGVMLVSEETMKCYYSPAFRWKIALFALALLFYFTLHRRLIVTGLEDNPSPQMKIAAATSLALWLGVGIAGRAIGLI